MVEQVERPWYWKLAPSHGNFGGPNRSELGKPPQTASDVVFRDHDECYGESKGREAELICDDKACNSLLDLSDDPNWNPTLYERAYHKGAELSFCDNESKKCLPEDEPFWDEKEQERKETTLIWESKPQRTPRVRKPRVIATTTKEIVKTEPVLATQSVTSVEPQILKTEVKAIKKRLSRAEQKASDKNRRKQVAANRAKCPKPSVHRGPKPKPAKRAGMGGKYGSSFNPSRRFSDWKEKGGRHIVSGCDLIDGLAISASGKNVNGTIINNSDSVTGLKINPLNFPNTRLNQIAPLYQKWRPRYLKFHFVTALGEFFNGSLIHYYDRDPQSTYSASNGTEKAIQQIAAHSDEQPFPVVRNCTCAAGDIKTDASYWVSQSGDVRTYASGSYYMAVMDAISMSTGSITYPLKLGRIFLDYEIEFFEDALGEGAGSSPIGSSNSTYFADTYLTTPSPQANTSYGPLANAGIVALESKTLWDATGSRYDGRYGNAYEDFYLNWSPGFQTVGKLNFTGLAPSSQFQFTMVWRCSAVTTAGVGSFTDFNYSGGAFSSTQNTRLISTTPGATALSVAFTVTINTSAAGGDLTIEDPAQTLFTGTATGSWLIAISLCELRDGSLPADSKDGPCPYRVKLESQECDMLSVMEGWELRKACKDFTCPVCVSMLAQSVQMKRTKVTLLDLDEGEKEKEDSEEETEGYISFVETVPHGEPREKRLKRVVLDPGSKGVRI